MSVNPKGIGFWTYLGAAAVCSAFAYGPAVGMGAFIGLALAALIWG